MKKIIMGKMFYTWFNKEKVKTPTLDEKTAKIAFKAGFVLAKQCAREFS